MTRIALGLGSNLGDREANIARAVGGLRQAFSDVVVSSLIETEPMYVTDQPAFLNGAALASTDLGPLEVMRVLKRIEAEVGRLPRERYGPREIDIDLVAYGCAKYEFRDGEKLVLTVPHPKTAEREFVLQPLAELGWKP